MHRGGGALSANGPVFTVIAVSADGKDYTATVTDAMFEPGPGKRSANVHAKE